MCPVLRLQLGVAVVFETQLSGFGRLLPFGEGDDFPVILIVVIHKQLLRGIVHIGGDAGGTAGGDEEDVTAVRVGVAEFVNTYGRDGTAVVVAGVVHKDIFGCPAEDAVGGKAVENRKQFLAVWPHHLVAYAGRKKTLFKPSISFK